RDDQGHATGAAHPQEHPEIGRLVMARNWNRRRGDARGGGVARVAGAQVPETLARASLGEEVPAKTALRLLAPVPRLVEDHHRQAVELVVARLRQREIYD